MDKFVYSTDDTILKRFEEEGEPIPIGGYDDYLNLPRTEQYEKNEERKQRQEREQIEWQKQREEEERRQELERLENERRERDWSSTLYDYTNDPFLGMKQWGTKQD